MVEEMDRRRALKVVDVAVTEMMTHAPPVDLAADKEKGAAKAVTERESIRRF